MNWFGEMTLPVLAGVAGGVIWLLWRAVQRTKDDHPAHMKRRRNSASISGSDIPGAPDND
ncbi:hypothetical protein [Arenibacterium sp. CAU 1754]